MMMVDTIVVTAMMTMTTADGVETKIAVMTVMDATTLGLN